MKAERLAEVLARMTTGKSKSEALSAFELFKAFLLKRGYQSLLPRILKEYDRISSRATVSNTVITLAKKRDTAPLLAQHNLDGEADVRIDETIVGGYIIETDTRLIDASHKNALIALYQRITR